MSTRRDVVGGPPDEYFVYWDSITESDAEEFRTAVEACRREQEMQTFLETHPLFLIQHLGGGHGRWVVPKPSLGREFEPDFLICEESSNGFEWTLVELEKPTDHMFIKNGDFSAELNHAVGQIRRWRAWLVQRGDYARGRKGAYGLGLVDIEPDAPGLVIMGRRADVAPEDAAAVRRRFKVDANIDLHSYDWLVERAGGRASVLRENREAAASALNQAGETPA